MNRKSYDLGLLAIIAIVAVTYIQNHIVVEAFGSHNFLQQDDCGTDHEITTQDRLLEDQAEMDMFGKTVRCV